jgi:hypothetical protein
MFCVSTLVSVYLSCLHDPLYPVIHTNHPLLYLAGSTQTEHLVQRMNTVLVQRQGQMHRQNNTASTTDREVENTANSKDRQADLLATLHTSFLLLLLLLLSSLLISLCELVVFSWHNRGSQTVWSALLREMINTAAKTKTGGDQTDLSPDIQEGDRNNRNPSQGKYQDEEDGDFRPDQKLLEQEDSEGDSMRM